MTVQDPPRTRGMSSRRTGLLIDRVAFATAMAIVVAIAVAAFAAYYTAPDLLWRGFYHDRNSHYSFGLDLALAARGLDPVWFFGELEKAKVWPPFHGLVLSAVLLIGGIDHRLAIVPSLLGWVATIAFAWLIARRLFADRIAGLLAATVATIMIAASPTFRLISADAMLEGLGAGLSAAGLWAYLRAEEAPEERWRWRLLALILTVLFFHKGNYWGLLIAPLALAYVSEHWRNLAPVARGMLARTRARAVLAATFGSPPMIIAALLAVLIAFLYVRGPSALLVFGRSVSLYPPENLVTLAYAMVYLWWALLWQRHRAAIDASLGIPGRALLYWHLTPVAISFLLPHRLSRFLWFVGPANNQGDVPGPWNGVLYYWSVFSDSFHTAPWLAPVTLAMAVIGALGIGRLAPGARAVFLFAALAWIGVIVHPQHQGRFMSSWVFSVWICAGIGAGVLLQATRLSPTLRTIAAAAVATLVLIVNLGRPIPAAAYVSAIQQQSGPSDLDLVRLYLSEVAGTREVAVFTTFGMSRLFAWMIREHCRCHRIVDDPFLDRMTSRDETRAAMAAKIAESSADVVVTIDAPHGGNAFSELGWSYPIMAGLLDAMAQQSRYQRGNSYDLPGQGATATIWRRR